MSDRKITTGIISSRKYFRIIPEMVIENILFDRLNEIRLVFHKPPTFPLFILFCLLLDCLIFQPMVAQNGKMKFNYLTINEGLTNNRVSAFCRDSKDYIWIGTPSGLNKFDGYGIQTYQNNNSNNRKKGTISDNNITCIFEDSKKQVWIGTGNGLNIYNPLNDSFIVFNSNQNCGRIICSIIEDKSGHIWIMSDGGNVLKKWVPEKNVFIDYPINTFISDNLGMYKNLMAMDSNGILWLGATGRGIYAFDPRTEKFWHYDDPTIDFNPLITKSICVEKVNKIWLTVDHIGFISFDPVTHKFKKYNSNGNGKGTNGNLFFNLIQEDNDHLLIAVDQGGINRFNIKTQTFEYIMYDVLDRTGLNNNGIWQLYKDREGILWVGTSGGAVNYYNPKKYNFKLFNHNANNSQSVCYNSVLCFFEDSQGLIWIGTDGGGISAYHPKTGLFKNYQHKASDRYSLSADVIICITEDKDHDLWMGTWEHGLIRYDRKTNRFYNYLPDTHNSASISGNSIWSITTDSHGIIWMNIWGLGIDRFDKKKGVIERFRVHPNSPNTLADGRIDHFLEDDHTGMWICTWNGLNYYDFAKHTMSIYNKFPDNHIKTIARNKDGNYWIGTDNRGIMLFNPEKNTIQCIDENSGLPNNNTSGILEDDHGNYWISSDGGITKFNMNKHIVRTYTTFDGLQGNQFKCALKTSEGEMYFGGPNGFNSFFPDSLKNNTFVPPVYFNDFQIFNKHVLIGEAGSPLKKVISQTQEITLLPGQSVFSVGFTAINYTHPEKNQYAYKLDGFDKEWIYTDASRRYITYTNLDPGTYTLTVIASNNDGLWNKTGTSLKVVIIPPLWKSTWFRLSSIGFVILLFFGTYYWRVAQTKKANILLKKLVEERTKDLEMRTEELHAINVQLEETQQHIEEQSEELTSQRNELEELNETKDKLFSILAHDLRNPFHVIIGFSELVMADYKKLTEEKIYKYLGLIHSSSKRGNDLLENILQWSRSQTGRISFNPELLELSDILSECFKVLEGDAQSKQISIQQLIPNDRMIIADRNMLKTIFRNLLSNAIKFTSENGRVIIDFRQDAGYYLLSIADNGVGIPLENQKNIFRMDSTFTTRGTKQETGTGLGLKLCKEFVERHGGKIWVESEPPKGSTIYFTIPYIIET